MLLQEQAKGEIICMVGDGINDAPALTPAHIGISVVTAADISIHVSDLLLTTDSLALIPEMRAFAGNGRRIVSQNLFWAFFYNGVGIGFAAVGALSPLFAAGAMVASSLIVTLNAQRLNQIKQKKKKIRITGWTGCLRQEIREAGLKFEKEFLRSQFKIF